MEHEQLQIETLNRIAGTGTWAGIMTTWNAEAIANRIRRTLEGKRFTFVAVTEGGPHSAPDVRPCQILRGHSDSKHNGDGRNVTFRMLSPGHAHIMVCDSYGVWAISSTTANPFHPEGCTPYENPYVSFGHENSDHQQIAIFHRAGCGDLLRWVIVTENHGDPL